MKKRITETTADFMTTAALLEHSVAVDINESKLEYSGVPLDYLGYGRYATTKKEQHTIIIGDTGCGKTRRVIIPTINLIGKTGESMIISDPKGELYQKTAEKLKEKGYEIHVINMREPRNGDRWNPLELIEEMYNSPNQDQKDKALIMLDEIIDIMGKDVDSDRDKYWVSVSKQFIKAVALTILDYADYGSLNFSNLAVSCSRILKSVERKIRIDENTPNGESPEYDEEIISMQKFLSILSADSVIKQNYESTTTVSSLITYTCIASQVMTIVNMFVRQDGVKFLLSKSDFDIKSIGEKSIALYIILPDEVATLYPLATILVNQIYSVLIDTAFTNGGVLKNRVNFILDEFANFTRLKNISSMLTASRSRGMRFVLVVQDIDQLEETYAATASSIINSNCQNMIFMGCRNIDFLKDLKELSGIYTEKYTGKSKPLISISDLQSLEIGEAFIFIRSCSPKHVYFPDYTEVRFYGDEAETVVSFPRKNNTVIGQPLNIFSLIDNINHGDFMRKETKSEMSPAEIIAYNASFINNEVYNVLENLCYAARDPMLNSPNAEHRRNILLILGLRILITKDDNSRRNIITGLTGIRRKLARLDLEEKENAWAELDSEVLEELLKKGIIPDSESYYRILEKQTKLMEERGINYYPINVKDIADARFIDGCINYQELTDEAIAELKKFGRIYLRGKEYSDTDYQTEHPDYDDSSDDDDFDILVSEDENDEF